MAKCIFFDKRFDCNMLFFNRIIFRFLIVHHSNRPYNQSHLWMLSLNYFISEWHFTELCIGWNYLQANIWKQRFELCKNLSILLVILFYLEQMRLVAVNFQNLGQLIIIFKRLSAQKPERDRKLHKNQSTACFWKQTKRLQNLNAKEGLA